MRVVFDTNVLVLYLMGEPATSIVEAAFSGLPGEQLSFYYSEEMFQEYQNVLTGLTPRDPETFSPEAMANVLTLVRRFGHQVHPTDRLQVCSHAPDNRFLECAVAAQADYLVTVNLKHFPALYQGIKTLPPGRFYQILFE